MDEFFESLKDDINHPIFEIDYNSSYRKSSKNKIASIDIVPIRNENEEDLNLILEGCNLDSIASGDELWSIQDVKDAINGKYKDFFLLHSGDDIIGMCTISGNSLSGFAIFPEYQGKGYGKQSLKAIIKKMRETNKEIYLRVVESNTRAVNLYKSLGFEKIENDPYSDGRSYRMVLKSNVKTAGNMMDNIVINNIVDNKVYHGSPYKLDKLLGEKTGQWSGEKGSVFVSPFKGIVSCFIINKNDILNFVEQQLGSRITGVNFGFNIWNFDYDELRNIPSMIEIHLNIRGLKPFKGESTGYIYTIDYDKYKNKTHMFNKSKDSDVEFLIEGDVDYIKCEEVTVKWICMSDEEEIKKHGEAKVINYE